ncbi:quinohemoprotein amine dehydrogenase subunit alpha [Marinobacterium sp. D7]|uniref:quinohemoprotein amine dehydrogenase subunit alpha n=1 Tax=Marinobacterium ramblicola TaxID=2849041 RepID=UPI001C2D902F|nr:quinohemoprotein amine dehydrogenase subunit alpha [Marinobacterium ramblicola]MBV1789988.1 quinohemoprotein amine dehydrogenase subunit alpha [Marinobacterium ramblicola]
MAPTNKSTRRTLIGSGVLLLAGMASVSVQADDARQIIRDRCLACHTESGDRSTPSFSRISEQRKTPEGWQFTINRMINLRGLDISADEKRELIRYLADTQGLAPSEAEPFRYLLEQDTNLVEEGGDPALAETCARCHSAARFGLQRRTTEEWQLLVNFHMGQFPTTEFHSLARDRKWYEIAHDEVAVKLGEQYPLLTPAWDNWKQAVKTDLDGRWRVTGFVPGKGEYDAWMSASKADDGRYNLTLEGQYTDGSPLSGSGKATVYTGYEWRATLDIDGVKMRQVMAADAKGESMKGRMFLAAEREIGGALNAVKDTQAAAVVAVMPSYLRVGESTELTIIGQNLNGDVDLGPGVKVEKLLDRSDDRIHLIAKATGSEGVQSIQVGKAELASGLAVYSELARVDVMPKNAVARIGGLSQMPKVRTAYRAVGYSAGVDGKPGTEDDLRLGYMPASWSIKPADEIAAEDKDAQFAGSIDAAGIFTPGDDGPNPQRKMSANNVGRLTVVANVEEAGKQVAGEGSLIVSVPDFVRRVLD